jgi:hypothetical protein
MASYAPRWKVRLLLRFEDYKNSRAEPSYAGKAPKFSDKSSTVYQNAPLDVTKVAVGTYYLAPKTGPKNQSPQRFAATDGTVDLVPVRFTLGANGIRQADTFKFTMRYADLPFDPRAVKACGVEFYLGTIPLTGKVQNATGANVLPDTSSWPDGTTVSNLRFLGWVDKWNVAFPDEGDEPLVELDCRDNTSMFIDQEHPPALVLSKTLPVSQAIALYLSNYPQFAGMTVQYRPGKVDAKEPTLKDGHTKPSSATKGQGGGGMGSSRMGGMQGQQPNARISVWDFLTEVAGSIGHMIRVEDLVVVIEPPRSLTNTKAPRRDDPFQGRMINGVFEPLRVLQFGQNILSLDLVRNYSTSAPKNVMVIGYDTATKASVIVKYPDDGDDRLASPKLKFNETHKQYHVVRVEQVGTKENMRVVARQVYESFNRNELSGNVKTWELASLGGGNMDPDLLYLRAGDAIIIRGDMLDRVATRMVALGYNQQTIDAYLATLTSANFQRAFYVRGVGIQGTEEGLMLDIQFLNFIEASADAEVKAEAKKATQRANSGQDRVPTKAVPPTPSPTASAPVYAPRDNGLVSFPGDSDARGDILSPSGKDPLLDPNVLVPKRPRSLP